MEHKPTGPDSGASAPFVPRPTQAPAQRPAPSWAKKSPPKSKAATRTTPRAPKYLPPSDPQDHARKIAEVVIDTWYSSFGGSSLEVPVGTVASLALLRQPKVTGPGLADWILCLEPHELPKFFREIWLGYWYRRPDLIDRALRLHDWAWNNDPDPHQLKAVHAVTHTAVTTGLLDLTGDDDPYWRSGADVLSPLLTGLRHKADRKYRGEFHTPPCVTDLMANILIDKDFAHPEIWIREPAVGSGGMLRSVAQRMRELDLNPHDYHWYGNDIDVTSAACAAVNTLIWDLGPHTVIGCSNTFATDDGGFRDALADARDSIEQRNKAVSAASTIAAHRGALRLLDTLTGEAAA